MNKIFLSFVVSGSLLASNYKLVPLSSDGIALSSSNLAKSFSADAAFINPANMGFLGNNPKLHLSTNYYNIVGARFTNTLHEYYGEPYYNAADSKGKEFSFILPTLAAVYPINDRHFVGAALYTDFAAVYGWGGDYAKALADTMNIRGGTAALSYAYKPTSELSFGAALTLNHTKLSFNLIKDNAKNPRYEPTTQVDPTKDRVWYDKDNNAHPYTWVYDGNIRSDNGYKFGYKLALTYAPKYFEDRLRFSFVYNSSYKNDFKGRMNFRMSKFAMYDALWNSGITEDVDDNLPWFNENETEMMSNAFTMALLSITGEIGEMNPQYMVTAEGKRFVDFDFNSLKPSQDDAVSYDGFVSTNFLYPASANLGIAYEYGKHEFMLNIGRTYWSKTKPLRIQVEEKELPDAFYDKFMKAMVACMTPGSGINCKDDEEFVNLLQTKLKELSQSEKEEVYEALLASVLAQEMDQGWKDTTLISLGYRYNYSDKLALMLGFATEDSPVRRDRISFLAKDSRMYMYSMGFEYKISKNFKLSFGAAYQHYADVDVNNTTDVVLIQTQGKFRKQSNQIINLGINYEF